MGLHAERKRCHAVNPLPSEEVRKALGDRIELTAHQVQVLKTPLPRCPLSIQHLAHLTVTVVDQALIPYISNEPVHQQ